MTKRRPTEIMIKEGYGIEEKQSKTTFNENEIFLNEKTKLDLNDRGEIYRARIFTDDEKVDGNNILSSSYTKTLESEIENLRCGLHHMQLNKEIQIITPFEHHKKKN